MNNMDYKVIQEMQKLNKIKEKYDCLTCEVVIPVEFKEHPMSIIQGNGGLIEMAMLVNSLEDVIKSIKGNFPDVNDICPMIREHGGGMKEAYKRIEMRGNFKW